MYRSMTITKVYRKSALAPPWISLLASFMGTIVYIYIRDHSFSVVFEQNEKGQQFHANCSASLCLIYASLLTLLYSSPWDLGTNKILTTVLDGIFEYPHIVALKKNIRSPGHPWAFSWNWGLSIDPPATTFNRP